MQLQYSSDHVLPRSQRYIDQKIEGNADYVLTFSEIRAIMKAKGVQLEADDTSYQGGLSIR